MMKLTVTHRFTESDMLNLNQRHKTNKSPGGKEKQEKQMQKEKCPHKKQAVNWSNFTGDYPLGYMFIES